MRLLTLALALTGCADALAPAHLVVTCELPAPGDTCAHRPADRAAADRLLGELARCGPGEVLVRRAEPDLVVYRCESDEPVSYGYPAGWVEGDRLAYQGPGRSLVECRAGRVHTVRRLLTNDRWYWIDPLAGDPCEAPDCHPVPCEEAP